ncbi:hypothetical protein BDR05DRAFT_1005594 [Suillus weaverae]|nr:hypothetical protein BDR05DRAFT_1005594 [Suillus weaverae]
MSDASTDIPVPEVTHVKVPVGDQQELPSTTSMDATPPINASQEDLQSAVGDHCEPLHEPPHGVTDDPCNPPCESHKTCCEVLPVWHDPHDALQDSWEGIQHEHPHNVEPHDNLHEDDPPRNPCKDHDVIHHPHSDPHEGDLPHHPYEDYEVIHPCNDPLHPCEALREGLPVWYDSCDTLHDPREVVLCGSHDPP